MEMNRPRTSGLRRKRIRGLEQRLLLCEKKIHTIGKKWGNPVKVGGVKGNWEEYIHPREESKGNNALQVEYH